jgi:hypothetical protein
MIRRPSLVAAVLVVAIGVAGVATAAIPGPDGTVIACYELPAGSGPLRPVESASECTSGEASVTLGAAGAQGPAGPPGPPGPAGPTVTAEAPQLFERVFDGRLSGGRYPTLPEDGRPFELAIDVPAGSYIVLGQMEMTGFVVRRYPASFGTTRAAIGDTEVECTLSGGTQSNLTRQGFDGSQVWSQNLTVALDSPGTLRLSCHIDKFERRHPGESADTWVRSLRLTATRLPQTRVTRTVTLPLVFASLPGTRESRPPSATSIERLQQSLTNQNLTAIGRRLEGR